MPRFVRHSRPALALAAVLLAAASAAAAPIPKDRTADGPTDLAALQALVAKAAEAGQWPEAGDGGRAERAVARFAAAAVKAGGLPERASPVAAAADRPTEFHKEAKVLSAKGKTFVVAGGRFSSISDCVVVAAGDVELLSARNVVVFAGGTAKVSTLQNGVVVAGRGVDVSSTSPLRADPFKARELEKNEKPGEAGSVLVAGRWLRAGSANGCTCWVRNPEAPPPEPGAKGDPKPVTIGTAVNVLFLNPPETRKKGYEGNCRTATAPAP